MSDSVYRSGCTKCSEYEREISAMRGKLKAAQARPTMVMRFNTAFLGGAAMLAVLAIAVLGIAWVIAGNAAWVGRLAVVAAVFAAFLVLLMWNDARVDRVLAKKAE